MTIADNLTALADQKLGYQDSVEACKISLANKDVVVPVGAKLADISGLIDEIEQGGGDPSIPVGTGQHLVTFYDFDGKVLKRERVATGGNATAPDTPIHQYLTFAEWNNPFTNVQSDIDTGAIYNTTDGKTYLFITLTQVTGLAPTLYFSKSSTSLMTIDWGDGTTSTSTTSGNQTLNHTYASAGDYIITVDNSAGGTFSLGNGGATTTIFGTTATSAIVYKIYCCINLLLNSAYSLRCYSLKYISLSNKNYSFNSYLFYEAFLLNHINIPNNNVFPINIFYNTRKIKTITLPNSFTIIPAGFIRDNYGINIIFPSTITVINDNAFFGNLSTLFYIFLSTAPPTLANINAFTGINPICKIYVPDASVNAYKTATNWNNYSSYITPLSLKPQSNE